MKKHFALVVFSFFLACITLQAQTAPVTADVVRRIADNVLENTSFKFINKETGETYTTTKGLAYSAQVRNESPYNTWEYWNGVLSVAMVQLGQILNEPKYIEYSKRNYDFIFSNLDYFKKQYDQNVKKSSYTEFFRLGKLDDCGAMAAGLADVYAFDKKPEYMDYLNRVGNYILTKQEKLSDQTLCRPVPRVYTIWADDLYMSIPYLGRMGKLTGENKYYDFAVQQVENFGKYLYNPSNGLYYHCWYSDVNMNGVAHWGRCNGWVMMATAELLNILPEDHPKRAEMIRMLLRQIVGVSRYQDTSGLWHQVLDKPDSYLESSCTAMFVYSIAKAVNKGWIDPRYMSIAKNGWQGLNTKIQADGQVQDICIGTGISEDIKFYYDRPVKLNDIHGLGAIMLAGIEMMKVKK